MLVRCLAAFAAALLVFSAADRAGAQPVNTSGAGGLTDARACPQLKSALGDIGRSLTCTPSSGTGENIARVLADPSQYAYGQLDVFLAERSRRNARADLVDLRGDDTRECVFAVAATGDLETFGDIARAAGTLKFILPPRASGAAGTFEILRGIDTNGLGRAGDVGYADSTEVAIRTALATGGIALFTQFPEAGSGTFALVEQLGGRLIPVWSKRAADHQIEGETIYFTHELTSAGEPRPVLCTPQVVFTGNNAKIADSGLRERHKRNSDAIVALTAVQAVPGSLAKTARTSLARPTGENRTRGGGPGAFTDRAAQGPAQQPSQPVGDTDANDGKPYIAVPVFFGTDRNRIASTRGPIAFGVESAEKLTLGRAVVTIPRSHKVERGVEQPAWLDLLSLNNPLREDRARHFTLDKIDVFLDEARFIDAVALRLQEAREFPKQALVFVHGYRNTFKDAMYRAAQIAYDTGFDGVPFAYSWPSAADVRYYVQDEEHARDAEAHLEAFLKLVTQRTGAEQIHIIAHSMGNQPFLRVLKQVAEAPERKSQIKSIVLAAPDVSWKELRTAAGSVAKAAGVVTLYATATDRALLVSRKLRAGNPRAGEVTADGPIIVDGIDSIDASAIGTDIFALNHNGFAETKEMVDDLKLILRKGQRPPDTRNNALRPAGAASKLFWQFPPRR